MVGLEHRVVGLQIHRPGHRRRGDEVDEGEGQDALQRGVGPLAQRRAQAAQKREPGAASAIHRRQAAIRRYPPR